MFCGSNNTEVGVDIDVFVFSRRSRRECQGWGRGRHGGTWGAGRLRMAAETVMMRMGARDQEIMLTEPVSHTHTHTHTHKLASTETHLDDPRFTDVDLVAGG